MFEVKSLPGLLNPKPSNALAALHRKDRKSLACSPVGVESILSPPLLLSLVSFHLFFVALRFKAHQVADPDPPASLS